MKRIFKKVILGICIYLIPLIVFADIGPKPSITVTIKNLNTTNYLVDLFVYDDDGEGYKSEADYNGEGLTDSQIDMLHELNYNGWISESTRWGHYLLFADCAGNNSFKNNFSYFGTPDKYMIVIVNNDTGEIKKTDVITRKDFNSNVIVDYHTMKVLSRNSMKKSLIISAVALIVTVIIELLVAFIMKINSYKTIVVTNIFTNMFLNLLLIVLVTNYSIIFIIGEIIVFIVELLIYLKKFKDIAKSKTLLYTVIANIITLLITFIVCNI